MRIEGCYTAMVTPFMGNHFDAAGFRENLRFQIQSGVDGIVVLGSTGEAPTIRDDERDEVISIAVREAQGKVQVIAGTGAYATEATIARTARAKELGAEAALIVSPYYNRPTQKGLYTHFQKISDTVDLPIIVYNHPGRTGVNIEPLTLREISELPNVIGVKDSSGDIQQVSDYLHYTEDFTVLSGDDATTVPIMALGGHGVISTCGNLTPLPMVELVRAMIRGDLPTARSIHFQLFPLFKGLNFESNPIPIKEAMQACGLPAGHCRLPLGEMSEPHRSALHQLLQDANLCATPTLKS